jgi:thiamine biosynthesis lipoprotein
MILDRFRAMGTEVVAVCETAESLAEVHRLFAAVEACCSRFRADSDLSRVNSAPGEEVLMPTLLAGIVNRAADMRSRTGGLVDAGLGGVVAAWGYDRSFEQVRDVPTAPEPQEAPAWSVQDRVLRRSPGTLLDLGGIAKGWTCDLAVENGMAVLVSAGGDMRSSDARSEAEILGPDGLRAAGVHLGVGALATSSTTRRRWQAGTVPANHLIDPRTREPALSPVLSATAVAATAVEAEAGAKAILLSGADGLAWASRQDWVSGALVIWHDGSVYGTKGLEVAA